MDPPLESHGDVFRRFRNDLDATPCTLALSRSHFISVSGSMTSKDAPSTTNTDILSNFLIMAGEFSSVVDLFL